MKRHVQLGHGMPAVCRLGLATRGNTHLQPQDVLFALERGINYWNWCGHEDGMSQAVRQLGPRRKEIVLAAQLGTEDWSRDGMRRELDHALRMLQTDYLDVVTLYYVESRREWNAILAADGAWAALREAQQQGRVRAIGLTTHQRHLGAEWVQSGRLDLLMIRYNAAHRGAEQEIFPVTARLKIPVVGFTSLRWGALLQPTATDTAREGGPAGFRVPDAPACYRFVLSHPGIAVALMAPDHRGELTANLALLDDWHPLSDEERSRLEAHGDRVRQSAGQFP